MEDTLTCQGCGSEEVRVAQEGQTLQPSPNYTCADCMNKHNEVTGAIKAEREAVKAEIEAANAE